MHQHMTIDHKKFTRPAHSRKQSKLLVQNLSRRLHVGGHHSEGCHNHYAKNVITTEQIKY